MSTKFTAQHFPKGTVISTSLYTTNEEGLPFMQFGTDKPATFTVDHIRVADTWGGRIYLIVTTTKKEEPLFEGDDMITFNIDHVDRIVKLGTMNDVRYNESQNKWGLEDYTGKIHEFALKMYLLNMFNKLQPHNRYDLCKAEKAVVACGCVKKETEYLSCRGIQRITYVINKKKLKAWVKRNVNRFIFTQKEIAEQESIANAELSRDLEDVFDTTTDSATRSESDLIDELDTSPSCYSDDAHYPY